MEKVDFEQAKIIMDSRDEFVILDVREEPEYLTGHAVNAVLLPVDEITEETAGEFLPDKDVPVLVYCRSGRRSAIAAEKLDSYGYTEVYDIGSLIGWPYGLEG